MMTNPISINLIYSQIYLKMMKKIQEKKLQLDYKILIHEKVKHEEL